jgi:ComF family protein
MRSSSVLHRLLEPLVMGLYPGRCAACDQPLPWRADDEAFCEACAGLVERPEGVCTACGLPVPEPGPCPACRLDPPPFETLSAGFWYQGPARAAVQAFKLRSRPHLYRPLSADLAAVLEAAWQVDVVTAVPMTDRALRRRGYNPAWLLAFGLSRRASLPAPGASTLVKVRETAAQRGLAAFERHENVRHAFAVRGGCAGRDVLLVDDVVTTGATVRECARVLLGAGARSVRVVALARTPRGAEPLDAG